LKILYFIDSLGPGGKERRFVELLKGLNSNKEINFKIVIMNQEVHYQEVFQLNTQIIYLLRKAKKDVSVFYKFYKICKIIGPDIVHCWDSMTAIYAAPVCKLLHIKLVNGMVVGAPDNMSIMHSEYLRGRIAFPFSNIIIGNSLAGLTAYRAPLKKRVCIYNGFNFNRLKHLKSVTELKRELGIQTRYIIGMVASFSEYKDYRTFFKAAEMLLEKGVNVTFIIVGSNTNSSGAKNMIRHQYLSHFRLLGKRTDVESLVNMFDIGVLSTFTEGISNSVLEYMALGKAVVATNGGGTKEIVLDGITGFLIKQESPTELSDKMNILINDDSLRLKMGDAGKKRIYEYFSLDRMINEYITAYRKIYKN
jgi:glycosyltransferase involved in cell wall biosynthesis